MANGIDKIIATPFSDMADSDEGDDVFVVPPSSPNQLNNIDDHGKSARMFMHAVDVVKLAKQATERAQTAELKAEYITQLAKRATEEADSLVEVADCLIKSASSVARIALQFSQYDSFQEAFSDIPNSLKKMNFKTFMEITNGIYHAERKKAKTSCDRRRSDVNCDDVIAIRYSKRHPQHSMKRKSSVSEETFETNMRDDENSAKASGNGTGGHSHISPQCTKSLQTTVSKSQTSHKDNQGGRQDKFTEKFPEHFSPLDYKDSLTSSFDSAGSMPVLWENCCVLKATTRQPSDTWSERKNLRQFQIKLHGSSGSLANNT